MASHGKKRHTKRLAAPRQLHIARKEHAWLKTTRPGAHGREASIPLVALLRDILKVCTTSREAKRLLHAGLVNIDGRPATDPGFPVGLMDVVSLKNDASFVILNKHGKLIAVKTANTASKLCKVTGKKTIAQGKVQLSLHDGRTLVVPDGKAFSTGDTLKISIPDAKILAGGHFKLEKGSKCYVYSGRHAGAVGSLVDIHVFPGITPSNARIVDETGNEVVTLKDYVFVVDEEFKI